MAGECYEERLMRQHVDIVAGIDDAAALRQRGYASSCYASWLLAKSCYVAAMMSDVYASERYTDSEPMLII